MGYGWLEIGLAGEKMRLASGKVGLAGGKGGFRGSASVCFKPLFRPKLTFSNLLCPSLTPISYHPHARTGRPQKTSL